MAVGEIMIRFARLYDAIDSTTSTNAKVAAMRAYFASAPHADAAWATFFLTGRRLKRLVPSAAIRDWTLAATGLPFCCCMGSGIRATCGSRWPHYW